MLALALAGDPPGRAGAALSSVPPVWRRAVAGMVLLGLVAAAALMPVAGAVFSATTQAVATFDAAPAAFGPLSMWGEAGSGQAGDAAQTSPAKVDSPWRSLSAGLVHTCGIRTNGTLWCWGDNAFGQLGRAVNDITDSSAPVQEYTVTTTWATVTTGDNHTCATRTDGTLWCWGQNTTGQLGRGNTTDTTAVRTTIAQESTGATTWATINAGFSHTCATRTDATLWCWGYNAFGQLGRAVNNITNSSVPMQEYTVTTTWATVTAGSNQTCATRTNGTVWCWGANTYGQLGRGNTTDTTAVRTTIAQESTGTTTWADVTAGDEHICATRTDATLWCWGRNNWGQLGKAVNDVTDSSAAVQEYTATTTWATVTTSVDHTCATRTDATLWCWGNNTYGELGQGNETITTAVTTTIAQESTAATTWAIVAAGGHHTCATRTDGTLWCWGFNNNGQSGTASLANVDNPSNLNLSPGWQSLSAGSKHTCGVRLDGTLWCWGENVNGQLGSGVNNTTTSIGPVQEYTGTTTWATVATGSFHTCATRTDGTLWCWGKNTNGQLGRGNITDTTAVRTVIAQESTGTTTWATVTAGDEHTCTTRADGTLWCWGDNAYGQLGRAVNNITDSSVPVQEYTVTTTWAAIRTGDIHTCATRTDGTLWCWGRNSDGQLGRGNIIDTTAVRTVIAQESTGATTWATVSGGQLHTCAKRTDGTLWCWGDNAFGQLGRAVNDITDSSVPVQEYTVTTTWAKVANGNFHTCATRTDGTLWCWGQNSNGQLGRGYATDTTLERTTIAQEYTGTTIWATLSSNDIHTCATRTNGTLWCWGYNFAGQVGDGTVTNPHLTLGQVSTTTAGLVVSAGLNHTCVTQANGTLRCWGQNTNGQLADGTTTDRSTPVREPTLGTTWATVSAGASHTCAVTTAGALWCWGLRTNGRVGIGASTGNQLTAVQVTSPAVTWAHVAAGTTHTCATTTAGALYCWGSDSNGQIGDGAGSSADQATPVAVTAPVTAPVQLWSTVTAGNLHTCATTNMARIYCWGSDATGQLGDGAGSSADQVSPVQESTTATSWATVSAGTSHTCATRTDATLWCWGSDASGQIGDGAGSSADQVSPLQVTGTTWATVSAGKAPVTCATKTDGTLWCWGRNAYGELGDATTTDRTSPTQVGSATTWSNATAGGFHSCALRIEGTLYCWGYNYTGQLGLGPARLTPGQIGAVTTWTSVSAGLAHACALRSNHTLWCWGDNTYGQLGQGDTYPRYTPTQIGTNTDWQTVSAGQFHTCATTTTGTLWCWGIDTWGNLGIATVTFDQVASPAQVSGTTWATVSAGATHTCATKTETLYCWGSRTNGRIGDNGATAGTQITPAQVTGTTWATVSAGAAHTCATTTTSTLWCWGSDASGQLGNGATTTTDQAAPVQVTGTTWTTITTGTTHTCATRTGSTLWCWGSDASGQLGDGATTDQTAPVQVSGTTWSAVSAYAAHTCATQTGGSLWCWGLNDRGQLGLGEQAPHTSPVQTPAGVTTLAIATGSTSSTTLAITT